MNESMKDIFALYVLLLCDLGPMLDKWVGRAPEKADKKKIENCKKVMIHVCAGGTVGELRK